MPRGGELKPAQAALLEALECERRAQQALLAGERSAAEELYREVAVLYRRSWESAPPTVYGRLIGILKASVLAGEPGEAARYVREQLGGASSSVSSYALALAALAAGNDAVAASAAAGMAEEESFAATAEAIAAIAAGDADRYGRALAEIIAVQEAGGEFLTGVAIADGAVVLERLAAERGIAARPGSPLVPQP